MPCAACRHWATTVLWPVPPAVPCPLPPFPPHFPSSDPASPASLPPPTPPPTHPHTHTSSLDPVLVQLLDSRVGEELLVGSPVCGAR